MTVSMAKMGGMDVQGRVIDQSDGIRADKQTLQTLSAHAVVTETLIGWGVWNAIVEIDQEHFGGFPGDKSYYIAAVQNG